jgi:hypothetical protein
MSRNSRFVAAAKALLAVQIAGCAGAAGVTAWAAFEVRDMVHERDALSARVAQLEAVIPRTMLPPAPAPATAADTVNAADLPAGATEAASPTNEAIGGGGGGGGGGGNEERDPVFNEVREVETVPCALYPGRAASRCPVPWRSVNEEICLDVDDRQAFCPRHFPDPDSDPVGNVTTPLDPQRRDCRSLDGQAIVCVPPYQRTPVPGVCMDGNNRPMRCPRAVREPAKPAETNQQQPVTRR